jgi:acyl-CoA hydrolase
MDVRKINASLICDHALFFFIFSGKEPMIDAKPVKVSQTTITELMIPSYANFGGKIHGGILLSLMDKVAYVCAAKHAGTYCVTVSVDKVEFLQPVEVGELVSLHASVNYVGNSSLIVGIRVEAQNVRKGTIKHTNSSYFTMVAKGDDDKPTTVPKLILENEEEIKRFIEAMRLKEIKSKVKDQLDDARSTIEIVNAVTILKAERCVLSMPSK